MTVTEEAEEIVAWLESPEGELWSRNAHRLHHNEGAIASLKEDDDGDSAARSDPELFEEWMESWPEITGWTPDDPPENA